MNETNKFKDECGDTVQAMLWLNGILISVSGQPELTPGKAIEFFEQGLALAKEAKAKQ